MENLKKQLNALTQILKKNKNIKGDLLLKKFNAQTKSNFTARKLRELIYLHRCQSKIYFISAGDNGYNLVSVKSAKFKKWFMRYSKYIKTQNKLVDCIFANVKLKN